jgi:ABC-type transport system involved in cytochrome c biogenesis permease subunit
MPVAGDPWSRGAMDINSTDSWVQRPGPAIAVGIVLLAVCAGFAALWFTSDFLLARPLGLLTGSVGLYLVYGGLMGRKEGR